MRLLHRAPRVAAGGLVRCFDPLGGLGCRHRGDHELVSTCTSSTTSSGGKLECTDSCPEIAREWLRMPSQPASDLGNIRSATHLQSIPDGVFRQTISASDVGFCVSPEDDGLSARELDVEA